MEDEDFQDTTSTMDALRPDTDERGDEYEDSSLVNDNSNLNSINHEDGNRIKILFLNIDCKTLPVPPRTPELIHFQDSGDSRVYWDRSHYDSPESQLRALAKSSTLYVGNLNFSTRVSHIRSHFSLLGPVKDVVIGVDRFKKTPCGFCFVQYEYRRHALAAVSLLSGTKLDGKVIRVELDAGFQNGRQYGRGQHGGQVRDFRRGQRGNQQPLNQQPNYRSGDKRSRYSGGVDNNEARRPRMDDALPTGRMTQANDDDGYYGPVPGNEIRTEADGSMGDDLNETTLSRDIVTGNIEDGNNIEGDDDHREIEDEPSSKRQRMS